MRNILSLSYINKLLVFMRRSTKTRPAADPEIKQTRIPRVAHLRRLYDQSAKKQNVYFQMSIKVTFKSLKLMPSSAWMPVNKD